MVVGPVGPHALTLVRLAALSTPAGVEVVVAAFAMVLLSTGNVCAGELGEKCDGRVPTHVLSLSVVQTQWTRRDQVEIAAGEAAPTVQEESRIRLRTSSNTFW